MSLIYNKNHYPADKYSGNPCVILQLLNNWAQKEGSKDPLLDRVAIDI